MLDSGPFQLTWADYAVIVGYLVFLVVAGAIVRRFCGNVKDYFIGGNKVSWWLAGASCFMMSFSAWTFTGAAGFAYKHGVLIVVLFLFNVITYGFAALFIAGKCRQTRCITAIDIIRARFGRISERVFTGIQVPVALLGGAIWLNGLGLFVSVAFGIPIEFTILIAGIAIIVYSTLGGSWAVMSTDFLQAIILMSLTVVIAVLTLIEIGGVSGIQVNVPAENLKLLSAEHSFLWILAYGSQTFIIFNSIQGAPRYLSLRDGRQASKAALFAAILFAVGPFIWFLPPIAASYFFPNIESLLPGLNHAPDAAYVLMGLSLLPRGLAGLLVMVVFAATLSAMDTSVNQNAGILTMNVYKPLIRQNASDKELFIVAQFTNLLLGVLIIFLSLIFLRFNELGLFDLLLLLTASIIFPMAIPFFLVYWIRKTAWWSAVAAMIGGLIFNVVAQHHMVIAQADSCPICPILSRIGISGFDTHAVWPLPIIVFGTLIICATIVILSRLCWRFSSEPYKQLTYKFYNRMDKAIDPKKENIGPENLQQFAIIGTMAIVIGSCLSLLLVLGNSIRDRLAIAATAAMIMAIGVLLLIAGRRSKARLAKLAEQAHIENKTDEFASVDK